MSANESQGADAKTSPQPLTLVSPSHKASLELVLEAGGLVNRLVLNADDRQIDVVAGVDPATAVKANPQYRGVVLFPFPNRLGEGRYEFGGKVYQLPINEKANNNNLHGFLYQMQPEVVEADGDGEGACVALLYRYDGSLPGYPFAADVRMNYQLSDDCLRVTMTVTNRADEAMPVGIGWHPYFCLGQEKVDDLALQLPHVERYAVDERMLPRGEPQPFTAFSSLEPIGATRFDDCFRIKSATSEAQVTLWSERAGLGLEVWQDFAGGLNYLQLCIPPDRGSIAIEPMSCGINAFKTGRDVEILQPGQEYTGVFGVRLTTRKP